MKESKQVKKRELKIYHLLCDNCKHYNLDTDWNIFCMKKHIIEEDDFENADYFCADYIQGVNWKTKVLITFY